MSTNGDRSGADIPAQESTGEAGMSKQHTVERPDRPPWLRSSLLRLYGVLAAGMLLFIVVGESMKHPIPEGKFEKRDGTLIDIGDYDPVELGPFPRCHPQFEKHAVQLENGTNAWVKNKDVTAGPYPVGHPENPDWEKRAMELAIADNKENRYTWKGLQPQLHLLLLASMAVMIGAQHGAWLFTEEKVNREPSQVIKGEDAKWFPVMGSVTLFGLFCLYKYFGSDLIKLLITCGIVLACAFGFGSNCEHLVALVNGKVSSPLFVVPLLEQPVALIELLGTIAGIAMAVGYVWTKNWIINNVMGLSFCLMAIKQVDLSDYKTGAIMLIGLFFYDIFWVFFSKGLFGANVMVTVATGVEAPIKLLFPRYLGGCGDLKHSMLGLGDIAVPGLFIGFLAKWDCRNISEKKASSFVYLNTVMVAYFLSLVTTVSIMLFFNHAQPALLYIVPYVLIASLATAVARGELKELLAWTIEEDEDEEHPAEGHQANADCDADSKKDK
eukprot:TRINITY_DN7262_c0_g1_i1.p1 TRINITY_DN7262_c0_g1~~TRINITY_DN7262_c0_g1_i1.p1  ORF type:complete len:497 (-),score=118.31 TRINITY_DN7262_c0_g1_i1:122-1612(-)